MAVEGSALPLWVNVAVLMGTFALLVGLGERFLRTPIWVPFLVLCGGVSVLAGLTLAAGIALAAGAPDLALKLELSGGSGFALGVAGALHFGLVYPRRVEAAWARMTIFAAYGLALVNVLAEPLRIVPAPPGFPGGELAVASTALDVGLRAPLRIALVPVVMWFAYLGLRGRTDKERKAGRILALSSVPAIAFGLLWPPSGTVTSNNDHALVLFGIFILGLAGALARGGFPIPLQASLRRVMDSSRDALVIIDADTTIVMVNEAASTLLGLHSSDVGRLFEQALAPAFKDPQTWSRVSRHMGDAIMAGSARIVDDVGVVGPGSVPCRVIMDPLRSEGSAGRADGAVVRVWDITTEKAGEEASQRARDLQDLVIRVMGHDLKAPIAVVSGYLELAQLRLGGPLSDADRAAVKANLGKAGEATALMREIMSNARAISRITMGAAGQAPKEGTDLSKMVDEVVAVLRPLAQAKMIPVKVERPEGLRVPLVPGFESVISNLVSNAIKYTPQGGEITVSLSAPEGFVRLEVADTGPGIPKEARARLFRKFERLSLERSAGSHGLGLSITAAIVELSGGRIQVLDRPDGRQGTVFRVEIPSAGPGAKPPAA